MTAIATIPDKVSANSMLVLAREDCPATPSPCGPSSSLPATSASS